MEDDYYKHFHLADVSKEFKENQELHNLYKKPKKDKGQHATIFYNFERDDTHQVDVLYLPEDDGYKFLLVCVDVATRLCDAEPMKHVSSHDCLEAIQRIYDRPILNIPRELISDSGIEFQGKFKQWMQSHKVFQKIGITGRHRQVGLVERRNQDIGKALHMGMVSRELLTEESDSDWLHSYRSIIRKLNEKYGHPAYDDDDLYQKFGDPIQVKQDILPIGQKVRVQLEEPVDVAGNKKLHGKFRDSDIRFTTQVYKIIDIHIDPHQPVLYTINKPVKAHQFVAYTRNQLQVVKDSEQAPPGRKVLHKEPKQYVIQKLIKKRIVKKKVEYLVKWKGFGDEESTWEPASNIPKHFIQEFESRG